MIIIHWIAHCIIIHPDFTLEFIKWKKSTCQTGTVYCTASCTIIVFESYKVRVTQNAIYQIPENLLRESRIVLKELKMKIHYLKQIRILL